MAIGLDGGTAVVRVIADASKLNATIAAQTAGATAGLTGIGARVSSALSSPFVQAGAIVAGVSAKMGFDFQDAFTRIDAISNASAADIARWRTQIMTLSQATAQSPKELADALYFLASAGLKANEIFPALEASAKAAAVGLGDTAQVGSVVAAVLNAYAKTGITATNVTDILTAAVRESRAEADAFGQTLGRALPIAARAGISFGELAGSLASLSNIGLDVYEASTAMRAAMQAIVAPGQKAADTMASLGLSAQDLLDAIHAHGLLGALQLLDTTIKKQTNSESDYLRTFRNIIPNVRALTGVLGLTGENAKHVQQIFDATVHSTGDLGTAFNVVTQGPAFKFRQAVNNIKIVGTDLGSKILPVITDGLKLIAPLLGLVARNAGTLLKAFLTYKLVMFLPGLLDAIGVGLQLVGASYGIAAVDALGIRLVGFAATGYKAAAATAAGAYALGSWSAQAHTSSSDLQHLNEIAQSYLAWQNTAKSTGQSLSTILGAQATQYHGNAEALVLAVTNGISYDKALYAIKLTAQGAYQSVSHVPPVVVALGNAMEQAGHKYHATTKEFERFGFASDKAFATFKQGLLGTVQVSVGQFKKLGDAFKTTPAQLAAQLNLAVTIARRFHSDLKAIFSNKDLSMAQKQALAALPADQRDAWVQAGGAARKEMTHQAVVLAKLNSSIAGDITQKSIPKYKAGGHDAGHQFGVGLADGINSSQQIAAAAAARIAHIVLATAKGVLGVASPSTVGRQYGAWFVEGLILGLKSRETALSNAAGHVVDIMVSQLSNAHSKLQSILGKIKSDLQNKLGKDYTKSAYLDAVAHNVAVAAEEAAIALARSRVQQANELQKMVTQAQKSLDKIIQKFKDFKSSIQSGFADFGNFGQIISDQWAQYQTDLKSYQDALTAFNADPNNAGQPFGQTAPAAPDFSATIQQQVANAQRLAADLQNAATAGLSKELLAQFASQGAAGANALEQLMANPELIAQLNAASKTISDAANSTASALGNQFFGAAIKDATKDFQNASLALKMFIKAMEAVLAGLGAANQLQHLQHALNQAGGAGGGGSGGGGGGGGSGPGPNGPGRPDPYQTPPIIARGGASLTIAGGTFHFHGVQDIPSLMRALQEATAKDARANAGKGGFTDKGR